MSTNKWIGRAVVAGFVTCGSLVTPQYVSADQTPARTSRASTGTLEDRIAFRLETDDRLRKYDIDVDVDGSVATLSGEVATAAQKAEAERIAKVDGVTRVENKVTVDANADRTLTERAKKGLNKSGEAISDAWITTKVKWFFMGEDALEGSDINVDTEQNVVTLKGTVASEAGRTRAKALAMRTEGVKDVKDELRIAPAR